MMICFVAYGVQMDLKNLAFVSKREWNAGELHSPGFCKFTMPCIEKNKTMRSKF